MADEDLVEKLGNELGYPTATVVIAENPRDRHFIAETLLTAAALFLLKKYFDGFVEGLGIKKLGEQHAALALLTAKQAMGLLQEQKRTIVAAIEEYRGLLQQHRNDTASRKRGEDVVVGFLVERGIPEAKAEEIGRGISAKVFHD